MNKSRSNKLSDLTDKEDSDSESENESENESESDSERESDSESSDDESYESISSTTTDREVIQRLTDGETIKRLLAEHNERKEARKASQKEYNIHNYQKNREKILTGLLEKKKCPYCKKHISYYNMKKHQGSSNCVLTKLKNDELIVELELLRERVKKFK